MGCCLGNPFIPDISPSYGNSAGENDAKKLSFIYLFSDGRDAILLK